MYDFPSIFSLQKNQSDSSFTFNFASTTDEKCSDSVLLVLSTSCRKATRGPNLENFGLFKWARLRATVSPLAASSQIFDTVSRSSSSGLSEESKLEESSDSFDLWQPSITKRDMTKKCFTL